MKNIKTSIISLILVLILACTGCGKAPAPDSVITKYCDAMKQWDKTTMSSCMENGETKEISDLEEADDEYTALILDSFKSEATNIAYEIVSVESSDSTATVTVKFTYSDYSSAIKDAFSNYFIKAFTLAFSGGSEEELSQVFVDSINESLSTHEKGTASSEIQFKCVLVDKEWKIKEITDSDELTNVLTCNFVEALSNVGDMFDSSDSSEDTNSIGTVESEPKLSVEYVSNDGKIFKGYDGEVNVSSWIKYKNTSDCDIKLTNVTISYLDNDGKLLGADTHCQCIPEVLKPGEEGYVYSYYYKLGSAYTNNGCKPDIEYVIKQSKDTYSLEVVDSVFKEGWLGIEVTARAQNEGGEISSARPGAVFYDVDGNVLGFCYGLESFSNGTTTFNISGDLLGYGDDTSAVSYVEVYIQGDDSWY